MSGNLLRRLPHSIDAEMAFLGAQLTYPNRRLGNGIQQDHFIRSDHGALFAMIREAQDAGIAFDAIVAEQWILNDDLFADWKESDYLRRLVECAATPINAEQHAHLITDLAAKRDLIYIAADLETAAYAADVTETADTLRSRHVSVLEDHTANFPDSIITKDGVDPLSCTVDFWLSRELSQSEPLMRPWLYPGERYLIWGERGCGKSAVKIALAFALATGRALGTWASTRAARVVYLDGEMSQLDLQDRIKEMAACFGNPGSNLLPISTVDFPQFAPLDQEIRARAFAKMLKAFGADVVLIDNVQCLVSTSIKGGDAYDGLQPVMLLLREYSIASVWGHHAGFCSDHHYGDSRIDWQMAGSLKAEQLAAGPGELKVSVTIDVYGKPPRNRRLELKDSCGFEEGVSGVLDVDADTPWRRSNHQLML
jgi:hypothetical protein